MIHPEFRRVASPRDRVKWTEEADEARRHPGEWFQLRTASTGNAAWSQCTSIKNGRRAAFRPAGSFEAVARGCTVLIRYVGGTERLREGV